MDHTRALVIGAGPVGLFTALELLERGVGVTIVDQKDPFDAQSFAVVLHPRMLAELIDRGLGEPLVWQGCPLKRVLIYSDGVKRATAELPAGSAVSEGGLTLPQSVLRRALESALRARGTEVRYRHRLVSLEQSATSVLARLSDPDGTSLSVQADFVLAADGHDSTVRKLIGVELLPRGSDEIYAFFDVSGDSSAGFQSELAFTGAFNDAMMPLHGGMRRYAFQLSDTPSHPPDPIFLRELQSVRMPWHHGEAERVEWSGVAKFRRAVADHFGQGRVWLVGDAAHATNPLGVQSMNVGLYEGRQVAGLVDECLRGAPLHIFESRYEARSQSEWNRLLQPNLGGGLSPRVPAWIRDHVVRLVSCLPASGDDLDDLLDQLGVTLL
jgi:3-(3-hydroxy-phenyl)propionate hydroxylase